MTDQWFFLNREVVLIRAPRGSAIYNLFNGEIFSPYQEEIAEMLALAEQGFRISEIARRLSWDIESVKGTFENLERQGIGRFYNKKVYIEKYKIGIPLTDVRDVPPTITKCFIELPTECDAGCSFCTSPKLWPCVTCTQVHERPVQDYEQLLYVFLSRILKMQCFAIVFHGGDPFTNEALLLSLVKFCREKGFDGQLFVITCGKHLNAHIINFMSKYKVHPIIPFGGLARKTPISLRALTDVTRRLKQKGLNFTISVVMNNTDDTEIHDLIRNMSPDRILETVILNLGDKSNLRNVQGVLKKYMLKATANTLYHNRYFHPCLHGTLAVTVRGDLLPCPYMRSEVLGNIRDPEVIDIVFERRLIDRYWRMTLSNVEGCKECGLRYGCMDCRAVEFQLTGKIDGKALCPHDRIAKDYQ